MPEVTSQQVLNELNEFALEIYKGNQAAVDLYMFRPNRLFDGLRPADIIHESGGAERVRNALGRAAYGSGQV